MSSSFESLPLEMFELVVQQTSLVDIWNLQQCNTALEITLDPYMLANPHAAHKLMRWGCLEGNTWAIKKAISLGADVSAVQVAWREDDTSILSSTLGLAATTCQHDAFEFLLKSGAQPDVAIHNNQSASFKNRLFTPQLPRFIQLCQDYGLKDRIPNLQVNLDEALVESVKMNLGLDICQTWMDLGANPTSRVGKSWNPETALALAILSGSITLAKVMISRGCDLEVSGFPGPKRLAFEQTPKRDLLEPWRSVPMIAAARRLATEGHRDMIELLLEAGADINAQCRGWMESFQRRPHRESHVQRAITPLWTYLLSVDLNNLDPKTSPCQMVNWLLSQGASIRLADTHQDIPMELLDLWRHFKGARCLLNDDIYAIIKLLLENGAAKDKVPQWLTEQGLNPGQFLPRKYHFNMDEEAVCIQRWGVIVDLLLQDDNFDGGLSPHLDGLLMRLVHRIMHYLFKCDEVSGIRHPGLLTDTYDVGHPIMIQRLLARGARINAASFRCSDGELILSYLTNHTHRHPRLSWLPRFGAHRVGQQRSFLSMIANLGAAPVFGTVPLRPEPSDVEGEFRLWKCALRGEVSDEERLFWNPTSRALVDIPDRLDPHEREELRRERKDAKELCDRQEFEEKSAKLAHERIQDVARVIREILMG